MSEPNGAPPSEVAAASGAWRPPPWGALALIAGLFLAALLSQYFEPAAKFELLRALHRSISIFSGNAAWAFDPPDPKESFSWPMKIIAIFAPVVTAFTFADLITGFLRPLIQQIRARLRFLRPGTTGVAIFGLTDRSLRFAAACRDDGYVPVLCAAGADAALLAACRVAGIPLFRDRREKPLPWFVREAAHVVSFLPSPDAQIDLAAHIERHLGHKPKLWLLMADRGLARRLDEYLKFSFHRPDEKRLHPRLVYPAACAAADLLTRHPFDVLADAFGQDRIHLAIYGCGSLGRAVIKHAAQLYVTRATLAGRRLRVTIIDRHAEACRQALLAEDPGIEHVVAIECLTADVASAGLAEAQLATMVPDHVTFHVVAFGDARAAFAFAVSLRRWLLEPPAALDEAWRLSHLLAPICVRTPERGGLARLLRPPGEAAQGESIVPEAIFAFGAADDVLSPAAVLASDREKAARALHAAYGAARKRAEAAATHGAMSRPAEEDWDRLTPAFRESNFQAAEHIPIKARAIGYLYARKINDEDETTLPQEGSAELALLAELEHCRYVAERQTGGWRYAEARCDAVRVHPDLVGWGELSLAERHLDIEQIHALPAAAREVNRRFARSLVIGITGHRAGPDGSGEASGLDEAWVRRRLRETLKALLAEHALRAPLLLTSLAAGVDSWAAETAVELKIPFVVPLPLPHELYCEDFNPAQRNEFQRLVAHAEYYIEMPLRFGRASALTVRDGEARVRNQVARGRQYALAGGYIVSRAQVMIGVWNGRPAAGPGGTADILSWNGAAGVPPAYRTPSAFFPVPETQDYVPIPAREHLELPEGRPASWLGGAARRATPNDAGG